MVAVSPWPRCQPLRDSTTLSGKRGANKGTADGSGGVSSLPHGLEWSGRERFKLHFSPSSHTQRSVQKVPSHALRKQTFTEEDTRDLHTGRGHESPSTWAPQALTQFSQHLFHRSKHSAKSFAGIAISCPVVFS